ncbi:S-adenosyl-L-methionine-dependent methyltransferase [Haematococcus lacustris]
MQRRALQCLQRLRCMYRHASGFATDSANGATKEQTQLMAHLRAKILMRGGPISMAEYMQDALTSPQGGFYMHRDVFGKQGDFITSPEISQMFGEMLGVWAVHTWASLGRPSRLGLVELGPGRGTLMADMLRATAGFTDFARAVEVHLVEVSPALRALQWKTLGCAPHPLVPGSPPLPPSSSPSSASPPPHLHLSGEAVGQGGSGVGAQACPTLGVRGKLNTEVAWHSSLDAVPRSLPALFIAHEYFDALPVHQFVKDPQRGWVEKMVDVEEGGEGEGPQGLRLVLSPAATPAAALLVKRRLAAMAADEAAACSALEVGAQAMAAAEALALRVGAQGGAALVVDYGREGHYSDSVMAIKEHRGVELLSQPGTADLSAWVDFTALRAGALGSGAPVRVSGPINQADFLLQLGMGQRLQQLLKKASPEQASDLVSGFQRLTDTQTEAGMGQSYKVMAITHEVDVEPAGFDGAMSVTQQQRAKQHNPSC